MGEQGSWQVELARQAWRTRQLSGLTAEMVRGHAG